MLKLILHKIFLIFKLTFIFTHSTVAAKFKFDYTKSWRIYFQSLKRRNLKNWYIERWKYKNNNYHRRTVFWFFKILWSFKIHIETSILYQTTGHTLVMLQNNCGKSNRKAKCAFIECYQTIGPGTVWPVDRQTQLFPHEWFLLHALGDFQWRKLGAFTSQIS